MRWTTPAGANRCWTSRSVPRCCSGRGRRRAGNACGSTGRGRRWRSAAGTARRRVSARPPRPPGGRFRSASAAGPADGRPPITAVRCAWITSAADPARHAREIRPRFIRFGELLVGALRAVGVDARARSGAGEYCPGEFSINDGHGHKLVGTAQRLVRGGWLFGTVILVADAGAGPRGARGGVRGARAALGPGTGAPCRHRARVTVDDAGARCWTPTPGAVGVSPWRRSGGRPRRRVGSAEERHHVPGFA